MIPFNMDEWLPNELTVNFQQGNDLWNRSVDQLYGELTVYLYLEGVEYIAKCSGHPIPHHRFDHRKEMLKGELLRRGIEPRFDYNAIPTARPKDLQKANSKGGIEL
jgi:uncharacterized protein with LGFP repeats